MKRVAGIGGIFFMCENPEQLYKWYEKHLGIKRMPDNGAVFNWRQVEDNKPAMTVWSLFPRDTEYFKPGHSTFMVNYRVKNLDGLLKVLKEEGVEIDEKREDSEYGRFAWITDPEGNRFELWEPPKES